jgi:uncharacterized membrane protein
VSILLISEQLLRNKFCLVFVHSAALQSKLHFSSKKIYLCLVACSVSNHTLHSAELQFSVALLAILYCLLTAYHSH